MHGLQSPADLKAQPFKKYIVPAPKKRIIFGAGTHDALLC
jgi:hypothetical protein